VFGILVSQGLLACGGGVSVGAPAQAPSGNSGAEEGEAVDTGPYSRFTDPYYLTFDAEANPFARRSLAKLWVLSATSEAPGDRRVVRIEEAEKALGEAENVVKGLLRGEAGPCVVGVDVGLERVGQMKATLERRYLAVSDPGLQEALDAEVHLLRDETAEYEAVVERCPKRMFDGPKEEEP